MRADLAIINALLTEMRKISPADDAKLQHLKTQILSKLASPINPGNRKILIFTAFADTANYLYEHLAARLLQTHHLHTGKVTGTQTPKSTLGRGYDFQSLLTLFSPISKEKAVILPDDPNRIDILIGTDCISEGQNLQDCDYLINYDIHWNPVRIIQRFGRIDRIGSRNASIQLVNYWPDITLDEYINLKERVENRMVIADVTATGDDNVLDSKANDLSYRKEQLRRLQEEVIEMEDLKTGVSITDLGLNDFRMDLLNYVKTNGDLDGDPDWNARRSARRARSRPAARRHLRSAEPPAKRQHQPAKPPSPILPDLHRYEWRRRRQSHRSQAPARSRACRLQRFQRADPGGVPAVQSRHRRWAQHAGVFPPSGGCNPLHGRSERREGSGQPLHRPDDHRPRQYYQGHGRFRVDRRSLVVR